MLAMAPRIVIEDDRPREESRPGRMTGDRLSWHLWNWEQWMFRRGLRRLWYPSKSAGPWKRSSLDFDEMVAAVDNRCARAVDVIISDLPRHQCLAIHHKHLASVYRVRYDLDKAYEEGCVAVGKELARRGID